MVAIVLIFDIGMAITDVITKKALNLGVEPLNWRVWYFFCGALGTTVGMFVYAYLLKPLGILDLSVPQIRTIIAHANNMKVFVLIFIMHMVVFISYISFYYAQVDGPLSIVKPIQVGVQEGLSWFVDMFIALLWPSFFLLESKVGIKRYVKESSLNFVGTILIALGLILLVKYSEGKKKI